MRICPSLGLLVDDLCTILCPLQISEQWPHCELGDPVWPCGSTRGPFAGQPSGWRGKESIQLSAGAGSKARLTFDSSGWEVGVCPGAKGGETPYF